MYGLVQVDVPIWSTLEPFALLLATASMIAMLRFKVGMAWTLVQQLLLPGHVENVVGMAGFRSVLESMFGPVPCDGLT